MFSNSVKYALKAVIFLAVHSNENKKIMVKDISGPINVPQPYIAKLLQELSKQNIISSTRGIKGGFYLTESNREQPIINIIYAIEGEYNMKSCLLSLENCDNDKPCPLHKIANPLRTKLYNSFKEKSIGELSKEIKEKVSFLPL
ncbi:MAG TPA: Rrf2 family transcriptional regulator [Flavobacteriaceae bacterium]|nr:Rrf2 family transcriptional regulator [Flavobacteriaceae bacterium]